MCRDGIAAWLRALVAGFAGLLLTAGACHAATCPPSGASVEIAVEPAGDEPVAALVFGNLAAPSCDDDARLSAVYAEQIACQADAPAGCRIQLEGLRPGAWIHRVLVTAGEATGQRQGRALLLLDRSAGVPTLSWPLYRSVHTVASLDDTLSCVGCLRAALTAATASAKPALVQFAGDLRGSIVLSAPLPPLSSGQVTIDAFDTDGVPLRRTIDGNGLNAAALKIVSDHNRVLGLRLVNVGGDSDTVVVEGAEANANLLDSLQVIGRTLQTCGTDDLGCVIDGVCYQPGLQAPRGVCGDDGIALRALSGTGDVNRVYGVMISGARDKGVKVSDGAVAVVERSLVIGNAEGGMQATLGGDLTARENITVANHGTATANGLAANGAAPGSRTPGRLQTRGNLSIANALRGISVRSLSVATLRDDFICGNGTSGTGNGVGLAVLDAAGFSAAALATGLAVVHNVDRGVVVNDTSRASFAPHGRLGENAFAFNGPALPPAPTNFRNLSPFPVAAAGNAWEHCGDGNQCDVSAVRVLDIVSGGARSPVSITPALATRSRTAPRITAIVPPFAAAGELVRVYGSGFDAIDGAGTSCDTIAAANTCRPLHGNCVFIDRAPTEVIAVTPTMLVLRSPFTCVEPVELRVRTRWSRASVTAAFCTVPTPTQAD